MAAEDRSRSDAARKKRREQLSRWTGSETDRSEAESRDRPGGTGQSRYRVRFAQGAVFMAACSAGDREEVRGLLQQGADINHTNVDGLTALHQACIDENQEMVEFLVEHGANVNQPDNEGWTPLHAAASCGFTEIAGFLISKGARVAAVNSEGELPLDVAQESAMEKLLQAEIKKQGVDVEAARQEEKRLMLQDAQQWVNQGKVTVSRHPKTGATDLHVAAAKGYLEVIKLLLKAGFDVNVKDNDGWSSLHAAAHWGQEEVCRLLGESLCDMQAVNKVGQTAFDVADESLVEMLEELQKKQSQLRIEKEKQAKLQPAVIEMSPLSQSALGRTRRSSISRMSSKEKISLHDKERRALETLEPVAFEGVEEERKGESSSSSSEEESDTESETESEKVKTREIINNLNNELNSPAVAAATSGLSKKSSSPPSKPPAAPRSATGGAEEERKDGAAPPTSWRTSLRKTGSYGALNSAGAPRGQEESKVRDSSGGIIRSASSPRLTGTETQAKDGESREPRLARVPPTPTRHLFSIPDSSHEPPSSSFPRQPTAVDSTDVTGALARSSSYTRRLNSQSGSEVTSSAPGFQRSSSFGRKAEDSGTTSTSALSRLNALTAQRLARQVEDKDSVSMTTTTSSSSATAATQNEAKERRRSYLTPVRDEEAEAQRKARSRHARQSRRSTQGVTLTDLQEAEKTMKGQLETRANEQRDEERKREEEEEKERAEALSKHRASRTGEEGEVTWRSRIANLQKSDLLGLTTPADPSRPDRPEESKEARQSASGEKDSDDKLGPGMRDRRRPRGKRRGEGLNNTSDDNEDTGEEEGGGRAEQADRLSRGELMANDRIASRGSLYSRSSSTYSRSDPSETDRKDYKKLYEEMSRENARLQSQFQDSQKKIIQTKGELDKASQMQERFADRSVLLEMEKKERQSLERRVSELEEEMEVLSNLKADNQRLKDENGALIRVISKLSK
ncbi:protein phosphatase 1 regulatory subunit 12A-like isoform X2 [Polyodon spathula]|uniref:protein phosphatase 1 regulatory subunit 12A-like isoform X2 n=1 Tax=Polyodon spathula TaxID=7913 RepID=UPI001B7DB24F|nr:protein phosphatase 1 regulatory subunit 12A-like isoform X2 [Polyodon spathula]